MATIGFTDATEQGLLDYFVATYGVVAASKGLALFTGTPSDDAGGGLTEVPFTNGYARITLPTFGAASGTAPATKNNSAVGTFPTATGSWASGANITHFGIMTTSTTGGTLLAVIPVTTPKPVTTGDTPSVAVGTLKLQLGDVGDTFG